VAGDAAAIEDAPRVEIAARPGCEVLVFDLA
jgi:hypothetical protein